MAGWIKMPLGMVVDLNPGDFVLDGETTLPSPKRGQSPLPTFLLWSNGCNKAAWIQMALGMEVGLIPGDFVLDGNQAP